MKIIPAVFLDANVVIQTGKPPGGPLMGRVSDLVKSGMITVVTTDLTMTEVAKKHAENDFEVLSHLGEPHFRTLAEEFLPTPLPALTKPRIRARLSAKYKASTKAMFHGLGATVLSIDDVKPSAVFDAYAAGTGFFSGVGKKHQFPDAFIFECLKSMANPQQPVVVVSNDGDFVGPVSGEGDITVLKDIPALFESLGLVVDAPDIEPFLEAEGPTLLKLFNSELNDWGLQVSDVEDAEIEEAFVTGFELSDLVSFGAAEKGGDILVVGTAEVVARVSFTHPDWDGAMWDSEDKVLIPFDTVSGEADVELEIEFSMTIVTDDEGQPSDVVELRFRNSDFQYVNIAPWDDPRI